MPPDGLVSTGAKGLGCSNAIIVFKGTMLRDVNFGQRTTKVFPHLSDAYAFHAFFAQRTEVNASEEMTWSAFKSWIY